MRLELPRTGRALPATPRTDRPDLRHPGEGPGEERQPRVRQLRQSGARAPDRAGLSARREPASGDYDRQSRLWSVERPREGEDPSRLRLWLWLLWFAVGL